MSIVRFCCVIWTPGLVAMMWMTSISVYAVPVTDDFSDGQWNDGNPLDWSVVDGSESSVMVTADNSLRLDSTSGEIRIGVPSATDTTSVRARVRVISELVGLSFPNQGHWTVLYTDGQLVIGQGNDPLAVADTDLDPVENDTMIQMDWVGDTISAWAWDPNNPPTSEEPHATYVTVRSRSFPTVFTSLDGIAEFRFVTVSNTHLRVAIPEPSSSILSAGFLLLMLIRKRPA